MAWVRDQSERVAERVRALLREHGEYGDDDGADDAAGDGAGDAAGDGTGSVSAAAPQPRGPRLRDRLAARLPVRIDPGRGPALAVGVAVLVAALVTGAWLLVQRPRSVPVSAAASGASATATPVGSGAVSGPATSGASGASGASGSGRASAPSGSRALVVVDVAGKVHRPGLYQLPPGARIDDAVRAAGGPLHGVDLSGLNLAQKVSDGQQILVGAPAGAPASAGAAGGGAGTGSGGGAGSSGSSGGTGGGPATPVNLNSATLEQLETLPGVGPVLAQRILDWRTQHGSFTGVDQLDDVSGIGTVKFAALKPLVTV